MAVDFSDLKSFDTVTPANKGAWLTLLDSSEQPTNKRLKLLGVNSDAWRNQNFNDIDQRKRALAKAGKAMSTTAREDEDLIRRRVARACIDWEGFRDENGNAAPCTYDAVYQVLSHPTVGVLILDQALNFILDPSNHGEDGEKHPNPLTPGLAEAEIEGN